MKAPKTFDEKFDEMKALSAKLSRGIPQIRVDFYEADGELFVGELTLFHFSGMVPFEPDEWDEIFGSYIDLPKREGAKKV